VYLSVCFFFISVLFLPSFGENKEIYIIMTYTQLVYNLKLDFFFTSTTLFYSAELLTDFSHTNFTVNYRGALDRLRVHLSII